MKKAFLHKFILLSIILFSLVFSLLELSYFTDFEFGKIGVVAFIFLIALLIFFTISELIFLINTCLEGKYLLSFLTLAAITLVTIVFYVPQPENLSLDSTQQISCAINIFHEGDWGFFKNCFIGYPTRQFYLPMFTSLLERSVFNLQLGSYLYMLIGSIFLTASGVRRLGKDMRNDRLLSIILCIPLHFHFFNYLVLTFEQAIYPVGLGLILFSSFINLMMEFRLKYVLTLFISTLLIISSYTTSLAFIPLILLFLTYYLIKKTERKDQRILILSMFISIVSSLLVSISYRMDLRFERNSSQLNYENIILIARTLLGFSDGTNYSSPMFTLIWVLTLVSSLIYKFRIPGIIFIFWTVIVVLVSFGAKGYASPDPFFALYRSGIIIPALMSLLIFSKASLFSEKYNLPVALLLLISGLIFQFQYFQTKSESKSIILNEIYTIVQNETETGTEYLYLYQMGVEPYIPFRNGSAYFLPDLRVTFEEDLCTLPLKNFILITTEDPQHDECYQKLLTASDTNKNFILKSNNANLFMFK